MSRNIKCSCCDKVITSGYNINNGKEYFCSDDCLRSTYSDEEYDLLCQENNGKWEFELDYKE